MQGLARQERKWSLTVQPSHRYLYEKELDMYMSGLAIYLFSRAPTSSSGRETGGWANERGFLPLSNPTSISTIKYPNPNPSK